MGVRERGDQFRRLVRSALDDLFDQRRPVGRLSLTHVLMTAGDTVFAVSLAGSLFFSISPTAAKDKVILYLLLTMGPFAVVAPALGPVIDRSRGARRAMVVASALGRLALCPLLGRDLHSLLLFPEAFAMLVLSKVYLVTKGALVPEMAALGMLTDASSPEEEASNDAPPGHSRFDRSYVTERSYAPDDVYADDPTPVPRARMPAHTPPYGTPPVSPYGTPPVSPYGTPPVSPYGTPPVSTGSGLEDRGRPSPGQHEPDREPGGPRSGPNVTPDLATLNARLGLLASLSGFVFALPAVLALKVGGPATVLWMAVGVFAAAAVAGVRLPVARRLRSKNGRASTRSVPRRSGSFTGNSAVGAAAAGEVVYAPGRVDRFILDHDWALDEEDLAVFRPVADREVNLALMPMSVLKALVGFVTFLMAFSLRRADAATWWFGFVLGALTVGAVIGVLLVGRLRRVFDEQQLLIGSLWVVAVFALLGAFFPVRLLQAVVVAAIGLASAVAKPSFDALVQGHVQELSQGKAFARFETRFQLMWVAGSFVPVVLSLPIAAGNFVMAAVAVVGAVSYMSSLRTIGNDRPDRLVAFPPV